MICRRCGKEHSQAEGCQAPASPRPRRKFIPPKRKRSWIPIALGGGFVAVVLIWFFFLRTPEPDILDVSDPFGRKAAAKKPAVAPALPVPASEALSAGGLVTPFEDGKVFDPEFGPKDLLFIFVQVVHSGFHVFETESLSGPFWLAIVPT